MKNHGFSLESVCWGYRDIFRKTIERLIREGSIGEGRESVTRDFFALLNRADRSSYDHVLKEFLGALNPRTRWIVDLPSLFSDITSLGASLADSRLYYGICYFRVLGEGGFGDTPQTVRALIDHLRRLREIDDELALALLEGYRALTHRLRPHEIEVFIREGIRLFARNRQHGLSFMRATGKSSENVIQSITREARLEEVQGILATMVKSLTGRTMEIAELGKLDSDELLERGSSFVCMAQWVYVPGRIRHFDREDLNRDWYILLAVIAAAMIAEGSFCAVHGHPDYATCRSLVGDEVASLNRFQILEYVRVLQAIRARWPGANRLLDIAIEACLKAQPPRAPSGTVLFAALSGTDDETSRALRQIALSSVNAFDTADIVRSRKRVPALHAIPVGDVLLPPVAFLPDFLYPGRAETPPATRLIANLKEEAKRHRRGGDNDDRPQAQAMATAEDTSGEPSSDEDAATAAACFLYDEWSQPDHDYYRDHCMLYEISPPHHAARNELPVDRHRIRQIQRVFERLRPDLARRETNLQDGESINPDRLVRYLVQQKVEPSPRVDFYEKPNINRRDLAVLLLLDVSGSTGENVGRERILDVERRAALIFGYGLHALGDRFAVCGFSGNGREHCEFSVYKDFDEDWADAAIDRLAAAHPTNATRIGAALRHAGYRLTQVECRQRLIIIITDGRPMDTDYDPHTRYAQYDVRRAVEENMQQGVHTFAISTEENSRGDLEIMFPNRQFVVLAHIAALPRVLPKLYIRMTV